MSHFEDVDAYHPYAGEDAYDIEGDDYAEMRKRFEDQYLDDDEHDLVTDSEEEPEETPEQLHARANEYKEIGNQALQDGKTDEAIKAYTSAIELFPDPVYYSNRAAVHIKTQAWKPAMEDCKQALTLNPKMAKALFRMATCHTRLGQFSEARETLSTLEPPQRKDPHVALLVAEIEQLDEAMRALDVALTAEDAGKSSELIEALTPKLTWATTFTVMRARALILQGKSDVALKVINALFQLPECSGLVDVQVWRGVAFYRTGNDEVALKHFQEVLRTDPDNKKAISMFKLIRALDSKKELGNSLFKAGDAARAIAAYTDALALDPKNETYCATIFSNRAAAEMKLNNWSQAANDCSSSLAMRPDNAKVYVRRARCWVQLTQFQDAVRDLKKAANLSPQDREIEAELDKAKIMLKRSSSQSFYSVLGIQVNADLGAVKAAYRRLAMQWHPDKHSSTPQSHKIAEEKFKVITEAYEVLSDATKRRQYDNGAELDEINSSSGHDRHGHGGFGGGGFGRQSAFESFFGGGGGMRRSQFFHG